MMISRDISSPMALEQAAHQQVPRMLTQWLGLEPNQFATTIRPTFESVEVDFHIAIEELLFIVEVRKTTSLPSIHSAVSLVNAQAGFQRQIGNVQQCIIPLVVVPYMTKSGKQACEDAEVSWLDLSGNAHIRSHCGRSRVLVAIEGYPNRFPRRGRPKNPFAGKAARVTRHLLLNPNRSFTQIELAHETDVDPGYTSRVVRRLIGLDLLIREGDEIRPRDPGFLLRAWREEGEFKHTVIQGHLPYRNPEERVREVTSLFEATGTNYAVTGLAAAWAYTHAASFRSASVYVDPSKELPSNELDMIGFRRETNAPNIRLVIPDDMDVFTGSQRREDFFCASLPQVFVDLDHEHERADELSEAVFRLASESAGWIVQ